MKASTSFVLRTLIIAGVSVGLGLAFNSTRPGSLPLVQTREKAVQAAPKAEEAAPVTHAAPAPEAAAENASAMQAAAEEPVANGTGETGNASQETNSGSAPAAEADAASPAQGDATNMTLPASGNATSQPAVDAGALHDLTDKEISLQDAARLFADGQAVFIDARDADTYAAGHVQGALSLPLFSFAQDFPALRDRLEGMTVITYCDGERCTLSSELADQLRANGLENVHELRNGWTLWQEQGLPTATGHNPEQGGGNS
jgi:rhodanese-related sulfurtransferase